MGMLPAGGWMFQMANASLFLSYLVPNVLLLRGCLGAASIFFVLFNWVDLNYALDGILWNSLFAIINFFFMIQMMYRARPIVFKMTLLEDIYISLFEPIGMSRYDFERLSNVAAVRTIKPGTVYLMEGSEFHDLTLIQQGEMIVYKIDDNTDEAIVVNKVNKYEFVESPQYAALINRRAKEELLAKQRDEMQNQGIDLQEIPMGERPAMSVSVKAEVVCVLLTWPVVKLQEFLSNNQHLIPQLNGIIGADVAMRLLQNDVAKEAGEKESNIVPSSICRYSIDSKRQEYERNAELKVNEFFLRESSGLFDNESVIQLGLHAKWRTIRQSGVEFIKQGEPVTSLALVVEGSFNVTRTRNNETAELMIIHEYEFLGSIEYYGNNRNKQLENDDLDSLYIADATYTSKGPCLLFVFDAKDLRTYLSIHAAKIKTALITVLLKDVTDKFRKLEDVTQWKPALEVIKKRCHSFQSEEELEKSTKTTTTTSTTSSNNNNEVQIHIDEHESLEMKTS